MAKRNLHVVPPPVSDALANELRSVDESYSTLRRSRDLDDRIDDLLAEPVVRRPLAVRARWFAAGALASGAVALALALLSNDEQIVAAAPAIEVAAPTEAPPPSTTTTAHKLPAPKLPALEKPAAIPAPTTVALAPQTSAPVDVVEPVDNTPAPAPRKSLSRTPKVENKAVASRVDAADLELALNRIRALRGIGQYREAVAHIDAILAGGPGSRVAESLMLERALLLSRAHDDDDACKTLDRLARRYPNGDAAADASALRAKLGCK
jgi:hypothetical protein